MQIPEFLDACFHSCLYHLFHDNLHFKEIDESAVKTSRREKAKADAEEMRKVAYPGFL